MVTNENETQFSFSTIKEFDKHIRQSIKGFDVLYEVVEEVSKFFIKDNMNVYDLGCSEGTLLHNLYMKNINIKSSYVGYDKESNLLPTIAGRQYINYFCRDITDSKIVFFNTNLVISVFTLQFLTIEQRRLVIKKSYQSLNIGGAMIIAEKILGETGREENILSTSTRQIKRNNFTDEELLNKEKTLVKIMQPLSDIDNEIMFSEAGFEESITIWQTLNFKCYLLIK
tara:strand:+ start:10011 stop:10691 length:681 start_codon:yes stop_codon:yes gene_type:complete